MQQTALEGSENTDDTLDPRTLLNRAGRDVLSVIGDAVSEKNPDALTGSHVAIQVDQTILRQSEDVLEVALSTGGTTFVVKALSPARSDSVLRLRREVSMLQALAGAEMAPKLIAHFEEQACFVTEHVMGKSLDTMLTDETLHPIAYRIGGWCRALNVRTPNETRKTNWKSYLEQYPGPFANKRFEKLEPLLGSMQITTFSPCKNDATLNSFIVRQSDRKLIGTGYLDSALKPTGWDLMIAARTLGRRFPDQVGKIAATLVAGWGEDVDGVPAKDFAKLAHVFAQLTAGLQEIEKNDPAQAFFENYQNASPNE